MSGRWMSAADRFAGYPRGRGTRGDGVASDRSCLQVLDALCRIAHDSGVAQAGIVRLVDRTKLSERTVKRALKRLEHDDWIREAVRGTGNRWNSAPRESVYVIRQLPDANDELFPRQEWLALQWLAYTSTRRWRGFDKRSQARIRAAWVARGDALLGASSDRNEDLLGASHGSTKGQPWPHTTQAEKQVTRVHPKRAERERRRMRLADDPDPGCDHGEARGREYCAVCRRQDQPTEQLTKPEPCDHGEPRGPEYCAVCRRQDSAVFP